MAIIIKKKIGLQMISVTKRKILSAFALNSLDLKSLRSFAWSYNLSHILRSAGNLNDGSSGASDADIFTEQNVTMPIMK